MGHFVEISKQFHRKWLPSRCFQSRNQKKAFSNCFMSLVVIAPSSFIFIRDSRIERKISTKSTSFNAQSAFQIGTYFQRISYFCEIQTWIHVKKPSPKDNSIPWLKQSFMSSWLSKSIWSFTSNIIINLRPWKLQNDAIEELTRTRFCNLCGGAFVC